MANWYVKAGTVFDDPACKFYVYCDLNGYDEDDYSTQTDADIEADDPYIKLGGTGGVKEAVIGLDSNYRIRITDTGVEAWDEGTLQWVDLIGGGIAGNVFKEIDCPAGTNPLAVGAVDTLILTSGNNILTIIGDSATNTVDFVVVEGNITHDNLGGLTTDNHHFIFENVVEDTTPELGGELDALTEKIVNLGDPTDDYDAVNYHTLLDSMNITLHYYLQGSNVMSTTVIDSEATDSEAINTSPDTMSTLFYKSTVLDTPTPFEVVAGTVIIIHTKMNVDATLAHKTFKVKFQLGYVDADGTSNFSQIGDDSDYTETLTTTPTTYNIHLHVPADHAIVAGKRLWLKVIAVVVSNTPPNYPDLVIYRDTPNQHLTIPVSGSILQNFLKNVSEDTTPQLGGNLDGQSTYKGINFIDPADNQDVSTKKYHDDNKYTDAEAVSAVEAGTDVTFSSFPITPSAAPDANYEVANKKYVDDSAGADVNAIHVNADSEISGIANKAAPVDADYLVIEDSEDGNDKKHITIGDLPGGGSGVREITSKIIPSELGVAGNNNCYWSGGLVIFGTTAKAAAYATLQFKLPSDYVDGENLTLVLVMRPKGNMTIDYNMLHAYRMVDGSAVTDEDSENATWAGGLNNIIQLETIVIDGTNFTASDGLWIQFTMQDSITTATVRLRTATLLVPVSGSD